MKSPVNLSCYSKECSILQLGGYWLPFVALGCGILLAAAITYFVLPVGLNDPDTTENTNKERVVDLLKVPSICVAVLSLFVASSSIGFLLSSLEPHMRQFDLSPLMMGKWKSEWNKQRNSSGTCATLSLQAPCLS